MTPQAITLTEARERAYLRALQIGGAGLALLLIGVGLYYFSNLNANAETAETARKTSNLKASETAPAGSVTAGRVLGGLLMLGGAGLGGVGLYRGIQTRSLPSVPFFCPYCNGKNLFTARPHTDFDCEHCNRTVHFTDGEPSPVRAVECMKCHAQHRVPVTLARYVCDKCNALMDLSLDPAPDVAAPTSGPSAAPAGMVAQQNFDLVLTAFDPECRDEMAAILQNLLVVGAEEANRLLDTISAESPLVAGYGLPERRAESALLQMRDLGANALLRPAAV